MTQRWTIIYFPLPSNPLNTVVHLALSSNSSGVVVLSHNALYRSRRCPWHQGSRRDMKRYGGVRAQVESNSWAMSCGQQTIKRKRDVKHRLLTHVSGTSFTFLWQNHLATITVCGRTARCWAKAEAEGCSHKPPQPPPQHTLQHELKGETGSLSARTASPPSSTCTSEMTCHSA